jgi:hypothetical protein
MKSESKHAPLPWTLTRNSVRSSDGNRVNLSGFSLATGVWNNRSPEENDALILRCVNSHDALVGALKAADGAMFHVQQNLPGTYGGYLAETHKAVQAALATLNP